MTPQFAMLQAIINEIRETTAETRATSAAISINSARLGTLTEKLTEKLKAKEASDDGQTSAPSNLRADTTSNAKGAEFPQPLHESGCLHIPRLASTRSDYRCSAASQGRKR